MTIVGLILFAVAVVLGFMYLMDEDRTSALLVGSLVSLFLSFGLASYSAVPAGYRGVLLQYGAVKGVLDEGLHFTIPFVQKVSLVDVRTQLSTDTASAASSDLQTVNTKVAVNFHIAPDKVGDLYKKVGLYYEERVIAPAVQETVKSAIARYTAGQLIKVRPKVKEELDKEISKRLAAYDIVVEPNGVSLVNFDFSPEYNKAIEEKQVAQQEASKQQYLLQSAQTQKQIAVVKAQGEAEANRLKSASLERQGGEFVVRMAEIEARSKAGWPVPEVWVEGNASGTPPIILNRSDYKKEKSTNPPTK